MEWTVRDNCTGNGWQLQLFWIDPKISLIETLKYSRILKKKTCLRLLSQDSHKNTDLLSMVAISGLIYCVYCDWYICWLIYCDWYIIHWRILLFLVLIALRLLMQLGILPLCNYSAAATRSTASSCWSRDLPWRIKFVWNNCIEEACKLALYSPWQRL